MVGKLLVSGASLVDLVRGLFSLSDLDLKSDLIIGMTGNDCAVPPISFVFSYISLAGLSAGC